MKRLSQNFKKNLVIKLELLNLKGFNFPREFLIISSIDWFQNVSKNITADRFLNCQGLSCKKKHNQYIKKT